MAFWILISLALALAMDAFAVSVASGAIIRERKIKHAFRISLFFGVFQGIMPVLGWVAGEQIVKYISNYDHWLAFVLLAFIGGKMIYEAVKNDPDKEKVNLEKLSVLFVAAIATSIDAMAAGLTLSFTDTQILYPAIVIGVVTFVMCLIGFGIGEKIGHLFERKIEVVAGLILIGIGVKIICDHMLK